MKITLTRLTQSSVDIVLPMMRDYHLFEQLDMTDEERLKAIQPLLEEDGVGCIWTIAQDEIAIGYIALCFCYSIEFKGRDAFIDEFYIVPAHRGKGIGREVLSMLLEESRKLSLRAIHLEVSKTNERAMSLYSSVGFMPRSRYNLCTHILT
jgi:ribosomal protein S18 acetylase RimI-like enzyme